MLILEIITGDKTLTEQFPDTKRGNSDLTKRVQDVYTSYKSNDWFMFYPEILKLKQRIEDWPRYKNQKEKKRMEEKLKFLEAERLDTIKLLSIPEQKPMKISIYKK